MITFQETHHCRWSCQTPMMPIDIMTGSDRWQPYLIVVILQCPECKCTKRWQSYVDDNGDILIGAKRAYADERRGIWRDELEE